MSKLCKFHIKGNCKDRDKCKYIHKNGICKFHFFGICKKADKCNLSHKYKFEENKKIVNTETFEPAYEIPSINVKIANSYVKKYNKQIYSNDVILVESLFCKEDDSNYYEELLDEIKSTGKEEDGLWKLWHGDTHLIADDKLNWKDSCKTYCAILEKLSEYFNMEIKATRLNWYRNSSEWKPYHHDAAALKKNKAEEQNITVGVSFGLKRNVTFQHAKNKTLVSFDLQNGMTYSFCNQVNIDWRHGIPPIKEEIEEGRISIIAWGKTNVVNL